MTQKNFLALALSLNLIFLLLCFGIGGIHFGSLDDFFMSSVVTGAYGGKFDAHTFFVNGAYAYFLRPFYAFFPSVGWYSIFQFLSIFLSFCVLSFFVLSRITGKLGVAVTCLILSCLTPDFYLQMGFTQCAAAVTAAGLILFYFANEKKRGLLYIPTFIFLFVGIVFRREAFLLGMPFLLMLFIYAYLETKKVRILSVVLLGICAAFYFGLQSFNQSLYQNNEYTYYKDYQGPRATFGDGAYFDDAVVYDELEERGMSGQDFRLLRKWVFYDTEVFGLDSLKRIENVVRRNRYELNKVKMPVALLAVISNSFFKPNAWCWTILCILFFFYIPKMAHWYVWGTLALIALCLSYLLMLNRVVYHVEAGIWLYAIFCAVPFLKKEMFESEKNKKSLVTLISIVVLGCFVMGLLTQIDVKNDRAFFGIPKMSENLEEFVAYSENRKEDVFLLGFEQYKTLAIYRNPMLSAAPAGSWGNIVPMGYWNINLPGMKTEMFARGVTNPLRDIVKKNVYVLDESNNFQLEQYYQRHYHTKIAVDTLQRFGSMSLLKYRIAEEADCE